MPKYLLKLSQGDHDQPLDLQGTSDFNLAYACAVAEGERDRRVDDTAADVIQICDESGTVLLAVPQLHRRPETRQPQLRVLIGGKGP
jgi:hypothetical protein